MSANKNKEITVEVTQEEYDEQIASGLTDDEVLKPGRHIFRRGGFLERHPNFSSENVEINVINRQQNEVSPDEYDHDKKAA